MAYTLEQFCQDAKNAMKADPSDRGREKARDMLQKLLKEKDFGIALQFTNRRNA